MLCSVTSADRDGINIPASWKASKMAILRSAATAGAGGGEPACGVASEVGEVGDGAVWA